MGLVQCILEEVAAREDTSPADLPPLYENLDPEALQELVESTDDASFHIEFGYNDYAVRIGPDGDVDIRASEKSQSV